MRHTRPSAKLPLSSLQKVADVAPGLITVYNIHTGKYVYVNGTIRRLLGYTPEEFLVKGVEFATSLVHPSDLEHIMEQNNAALAAANGARPQAKDDESIVTFQYRMRHAITGKWVWLHTDGSVFDRDKDGQVKHVLNISVDITAEKIAERKLRQLNRQLLTLHGVKDEFISIASHQLRTPATAVKLYASMLIMGYAGALNEEQRAYAEIVQKNNEQQIKIVNDLLSVARLDSGKLPLAKTRFDIVGLVADIVAQQTKKFELRNQQLLFTTDRSRRIVTLDKALLGMAIENVIDNAGKYSPVGEAVNIELLNDEKQFYLYVSDHGIGIAKKDRKKLFQKFSRLEHSDTYAVSGTGLGLYWAKKVIVLQGGTIEFVSELNKGTTFIITMPLD